MYVERDGAGRELDLAGVEPDGVEGVEVERRVGAVQHRPRAQLRGREPRDDNTRQLPVVELRAAVGARDSHRQDSRGKGEVAAPAPLLRHHGRGGYGRDGKPVLYKIY
jgi:hypothetical protein